MPADRRSPSMRRDDTPSRRRIDELRSTLQDASFTVSTLEEILGPVAQRALDRGDPIPARRALSAAPAAARRPAALARLFLLGDPVPVAEADEALGGYGVTAAEDDALVLVADGLVHASVDLRPYAFADDAGAGQWWIASDRGETTDGPLREDHVLGIGGATLSLTRIMPQHAVTDALDLGTGCGIQALHASRFADRVVATDISPRALGMARFNSALNAIDGIDFRLGDLFDPVDGEDFDLIVSNPPFVITPRVDGVPEYTYRDGGREGDRLSAAVLRECSRHLRPGGSARFLANWEYRADRPGLVRVREWIDAARTDAPDTDVLVIERTVQDPAEYAETWVRDGGTALSTNGYDRLIHLWLDDFAYRDVTAIGFGFVAIRRARGRRTAQLTRVETAHDAPATGESWSAAVTAALDAGAWLAERDDAALLGERWEVAPDVTEERSYWPGAEDPSVIELRKGGGWVHSIRVDSVEAALVGACDGELTAAAILAAVAHLLQADEGSVREQAVPRLRELVQLGFLRLSAGAESTGLSPR